MQRLAYCVLVGLVHGGILGNLFAADLITGTLYSDGITGRTGVRAKGWFEESVFVVHKGAAGTGSGDLTGEWHPWERGIFNITLPDSQLFPAGQYGLCTMGYDEVPGFDYVLDVDVPGGAGTYARDIYVQADYSVQYDDSWTEWPGNHLDERWVWGNDFYQTFVAKSLHITRLASRLVARNDGVQNIGFQLVKVNAGPPSSWTPVLPVRERYVGDHGNDVIGLFIRYVVYHSDEATITPGDTYALRIFCPDGTGPEHQFGLFARPDSGDGYAQGHLWSNDTPMTGWDAYGYVTGGGDNNALINYAPISDFQTADFIDFSNQFGQTFRATGEGLAAMEVTLAFIDGSRDHYPITFQLYQSVGGAPIGPPKNTHSLRVHAYLWRAGAFWHPFEAPLTPGQTYYIEATIPDGCNVWNMNEGYQHGDAYINRAKRVGRDVLMSIAEYEDMSKFGQVTPTPTPVGGANLLANWSFEQSSGTTHPGWTNNSGFRTNDLFPNPGSAYDGTQWASYSYGDGGSVVQDLYQTVAVNPGHTYRLTVWCYMGGGPGGHGTASLVWNDGGYPGKSGGTPLDSLTWNEGDPQITWTEMSGEVVPTSSSLTFILRVDITGWGAGMNFDASSVIDQGAVETPTPVPTETNTPVATATPTLPPGKPHMVVY